ncbi:ABC transporter substrate-binding protein [Photobacterium sanguinicancri]|uniref:ABC transporter substrate-binding protein n=1 Tax=Photobacterium sanguinicancri TaxID=875932 RepID=UPI002480D31A|nr:ABC transporter substrate-binding protein [Photobacterium sanguinicancri]
MRLFLVALIVMLSAPAYAEFSSGTRYQHEAGSVQFESQPVKVVALDWALAETLLSIGITPYGVADVKGYREWVNRPELSEAVIDVGSRREPNLELLARMKPDLIVMSQHLSPAYEKLKNIAPTMVLSIYSDKKQPLIAAEMVTRRLGEVMGVSRQAEQVIADTEQVFQRNGDRLKQANLDERTVLMVRFIGDKHVRIHGEGSLASATLSKMGITNAWQDATNQWGFASSGMEGLAPYQQANVMYLGPLSDKYQQTIFTTPLWRAMAFSREQRVYALPAIWTFGSLQSAQRLSDQITTQLLAGQ